MADEKKGGSKGGSALGWNFILSVLLNPLLQSKADEWAKNLPADHQLRKLLTSFLGERGFAGLNALLEEGGVKNPLLKALLEKASDFGDFYTQSLKSSETSGPRAADWKDQFLKSAGDRLTKAADPAAELARINVEFQARLELEKTVNKTRPASTPKPTSKSPDWASVEAGVDEKLKPVADWLEKSLGRRRNK